MLSKNTQALLLAVAVAVGGSAFFTVENFNQKNAKGKYTASIQLESDTPFTSIGPASEEPQRI